MGPIGCPETSVKYYHSTLRNIPEERRSHEPMNKLDVSCTEPSAFKLRHCGHTVSVLSSSVPKSGIFILEDGTDTLSRNVGKVLPLYAA